MSLFLENEQTQSPLAEPAQTNSSQYAEALMKTSGMLREYGHTYGPGTPQSIYAFAQREWPETLPLLLVIFSDNNYPLL